MTKDIFHQPLDNEVAELSTDEPLEGEPEIQTEPVETEPPPTQASLLEEQPLIEEIPPEEIAKPQARAPWWKHIFPWPDFPCRDCVC